MAKEWIPESYFSTDEFQDIFFLNGHRILSLKPLKKQSFERFKLNQPRIQLKRWIELESFH